MRASLMETLSAPKEDAKGLVSEAFGGKKTISYSAGIHSLP